MKSKGIITLDGISLWRGEWGNWWILSLPLGLVSQWKSLVTHLKGGTPLSLDSKYSLRWDPDGGDYSIKSRYANLHQHGNRDWDY